MWLFLFLYDWNLQLADINAVKCWYKKESAIISMVLIKKNMSDSPFIESITDKSVVLWIANSQAVSFLKNNVHNKETNE